jgi:hypothetical protein
VDAPWRRSGRLQLGSGDGRWGTAARARGGGEGPIRGGRGVSRGSPGAVHSGAARRGEASDGAGTGGRRWCWSGW